MYQRLSAVFDTHGAPIITHMTPCLRQGHASGAGQFGQQAGDDSCCSWTNASAYFHAPNLGYVSPARLCMPLPMFASLAPIHVGSVLCPLRA